jgi:hypothetical protein
VLVSGHCLSIARLSEDLVLLAHHFIRWVPDNDMLLRCKPTSRVLRVIDRFGTGEVQFPQCQLFSVPLAPISLPIAYSVDEAKHY